MHSITATLDGLCLRIAQALGEGGFQYLLAGARANVGIKANSRAEGYGFYEWIHTAH